MFQCSTANRCTRTVKEAFSHDGLGALAVKNVPGFAEKRQAILPLAWRFGQLPAEVKAKYALHALPVDGSRSRTQPATLHLSHSQI